MSRQPTVGGSSLSLRQAGVDHTFPDVVYEPTSSPTHQPKSDCLAGFLDVLVCECIAFFAEGAPLQGEADSELASISWIHVWPYLLLAREQHFVIRTVRSCLGGSAEIAGREALCYLHSQNLLLFVRIRLTEAKAGRVGNSGSIS